MDKVRPPENREQHSWKVKHKICELMAKINVFLWTVPNKNWTVEK